MKLIDNFFASEENHKFVIQTLVTDLARAYIELRALDQQLEISNHTVKVREDAPTSVLPSRPWRPTPAHTAKEKEYREYNS